MKKTNVFLQELAQEIKDPDMVVIDQSEWIDIMNMKGPTMVPDIIIEKTSSINFTDVSTETYEVLLNDAKFDDPVTGISEFNGIRDVRYIYLIDQYGDELPYDSFTYDQRTTRLCLNPYTHNQRMHEIFPSSSYPTIKIVWSSNFVQVDGESELDLKDDHLDILRKICIKTAIDRMLMDHIKLDRYRTLVGRTNEYVLMAMSKNLAGEIEYSKNNNNNSNVVKTF